MVLLELYISFLKIGFTSFGGLSMIPLISSEMLSHGWMTASEVSDIVAIAEMTPGPLGLNSATFAGLRTAGLPGAIFAVLGVLTPTFTLCFLAAVMFQRFRTSHRLEQIMTGVRPASIGLLAGVCVSLGITNFSTSVGGFNLPAVGIGVLDLFLMQKYKLSVPWIIGISAALGLLFFGVLGLQA